MSTELPHGPDLRDFHVACPTPLAWGDVETIGDVMTPHHLFLIVCAFFSLVRVFQYHAHTLPAAEAFSPCLVDYHFSPGLFHLQPS